MGKKKWWLVLGGIGASVILFVLNYDVPFLFDDIGQITQNLSLHDGPSFSALLASRRPSRIVLNVTLALNWLVSGAKPWSYHLVNDLLHVANTYLLLRFLQAMGVKDGRTLVFALILFLFHPLQIEAVSYVMGRTELLKTGLTLAILCLYARDAASGWPIYSLLVLGLAVKETCALTPLLFIGYDLTLRQKSLHELPWRKYAIYLSHVLWIFPLNHFFKVMGTHRDAVGFGLFPFWDYVWSNFHYVLFYPYLYFSPAEQSLYHEWVGVPHFSVIFSGIVICLGLAYLAISQRRSRPLVSFSVIFFSLSYFPNQSFLQFMNPFAEYRLYQPNAILALGVSVLLCHGQMYRRARDVLAGAILIYFLCFHYLYLQLWKNPISVWQYGLEKYPRSQTLLLGTSMAYLEQGFCGEAIKLMEPLCATAPKHMLYECELTLTETYLRVGEMEKARAHFDGLTHTPAFRRLRRYQEDMDNLNYFINPSLRRENSPRPELIPCRQPQA